MSDNKDRLFESDDPIEHYQHAYALMRDGRYADALQHYEAAISLDPDRLDSEVYVFAAWLLATCPLAALRNGRRAVEYATKACEITDWNEPWEMAALAAAYAETRDFPNAIEYQMKAIRLFNDESYNWLTVHYRKKQQDRLARYESRQLPEYDPEP